LEDGTVSTYQAMKNIIYLIPLDGIGGVEVAAQNLKNINNNFYKFDVHFIFNKKKEVFNVLKIWKSIVSITKLSPDILIVSLWRSALVGLFVKMFKPKVQVIFFIHSEKDTHFFDFIITRLMLFFALEVWSDSRASIDNRFKFSRIKLNKKVISFNSRKIKPIKSLKNVPNFIYWGRVSREKGIYRSLRIFKGVLHFYPNAMYKIIGHCELDYKELRQYCTNQGVINSIELYDEMSFEGIKNHAKSSSFYLQTSQYEGLSMSVMESMMLGLVPVATPVGEIKNYCNKFNSILVYSEMEAIREVVQTLRNTEVFYKMSNSAIKTWDDKISYRDSLLENCERVLGKGN